MTPPDYREAACCAKCWNVGATVIFLNVHCAKYNQRVEMDYICASYETDPTEETV